MINKTKQLAFLQAYVELWNLSRAAKVAGIDRSSHYRWLREDPEYPAAFKAARKAAKKYYDNRIADWIAAQ